jgi:NADH dehydrogenase
MATISPVLPLIGGGETLFQPVFVGDVAEAVVRCIDDSATAGRTYELGGPRVYSMRALVELLLDEIRRKRLLVNLPFGAAAMQARLFGLLPDPPLTPDQVEMLKRDNIVSPGALGLEALGIRPTAVEAVLPTYLDRFRRGGWYAREPAA